MSVEFNEKDYNLPKIKELSKLASLETVNNYRIYGLRQEDNPVVLIEYNPNYVKIPVGRINPLVEFFKLNKINIRFETINSNKPKLYIGLRKDIREHNGLCVAILQTIVHHLENRLNFKKDYKVAGIPKFS